MIERKFHGIKIECIFHICIWFICDKLMLLWLSTLYNLQNADAHA